MALPTSTAPLYEHADPREGQHPDWDTHIYNFGRNEVRNFPPVEFPLLVDHYGIDGLRVDAVASMLYRDYGRKDGEWIPNRYGGVENLEAIDFLSVPTCSSTRTPGRGDHSRGIDGVAHGLPPHLRRRPWLWLQMEPRLDARYARLYKEGSCASALPS